MRAVPLAVAAAYLPGTGLVLDPTNDEERKAESRHVFAFAFGLGISTEAKKGQAEGQGEMQIDEDGAEAEAEIVLVESEGDFSKEEVNVALEHARVAVLDVMAYVRSQMSLHLSKRLQK